MRGLAGKNEIKKAVRIAGPMPNQTPEMGTKEAFGKATRADHNAQQHAHDPALPNLAMVTLQVRQAWSKILSLYP